MQKRLVITILLAISGCRKIEQRLHHDSPQKLLQAAQGNMHSGAFNAAAENFKEIADLFCYLSWAPESRLMSAYAFFLAKEYIEAQSQLSTFESLYATHPMMDYALYLKGHIHMCKVRKMSTDKRDLPIAIQTFQTLMHTYPKSKYVPYAKQCIQRLEQFYIDGEIIAIRKAFKKQYYEQVLNRCQRLLDQYSDVIPAITMYVDACLCLKIDKVASHMLEKYKDVINEHPELLQAQQKINAYRMQSK